MAIQPDYGLVILMTWRLVLDPLSMARRNGTGEAYASLDFTPACGPCEAAGLRVGVSKSSVCTSV